MQIVSLDQNPAISSLAIRRRELSAPGLRRRVFFVCSIHHSQLCQAKRAGVVMRAASSQRARAGAGLKLARFVFRRHDILGVRLRFVFHAGHRALLFFRPRVLQRVFSGLQCHGLSLLLCPSSLKRPFESKRFFLRGRGWPLGFECCRGLSHARRVRTGSCRGPASRAESRAASRR